MTEKYQNINELIDEQDDLNPIAPVQGKHVQGFFIREAMYLDVPKEFTPIADFISSVAQKHKLSVYAVGGFVRDLVMNKYNKEGDAVRMPKDLDIVVDTQEPDGAEKFGKLLLKEWAATHPEEDVASRTPITSDRTTFTAKALLGKDMIDIAVPRKEEYPDDESRKAVVTGTTTIDEEAKRRDFAMNALYMDLATHTLKEIPGITERGIEDIKNKRITFANNAPDGGDKIMQDDPLRMIRAIRQALQHGFDIDKSIIEATKKNILTFVRKVSKERVKEEMDKMLMTKDPRKGIEYILETGLADVINPVLAKALRDINISHDNPKYHMETVIEHVLMGLDKFDDVRMKWAWLLHDLGKADTKKIKGDVAHFIGHEDVSAELAEKILKDLKFSNEDVQHISSIVKHHMKTHDIQPGENGEIKEEKIYKLMYDLGDYVDDVIKFKYVDNDSRKTNDVSKAVGEDKLDLLSKEVSGKRDAYKVIVNNPILKGGEIIRLSDGLATPKLSELKNKGYIPEASKGWVAQTEEFLLFQRFKDPEMIKEKAVNLVREFIKSKKDRQLLEDKEIKSKIKEWTKEEPKDNDKIFLELRELINTIKLNDFDVNKKQAVHVIDKRLEEISKSVNSGTEQRPDYVEAFSIESRLKGSNMWMIKKAEAPKYKDNRQEAKDAVKQKQLEYRKNLYNELNKLASEVALAGGKISGWIEEKEIPFLAIYMYAGLTPQEAIDAFQSAKKDSNGDYTIIVRSIMQDVVDAPTNKCGKCGTEIDPKSDVCSKCGAVTGASTGKTLDESRPIGDILSIINKAGFEDTNDLFLPKDSVIKYEDETDSSGAFTGGQKEVGHNQSLDKSHPSFASFNKFVRLIGQGVMDSNKLTSVDVQELGIFLKKQSLYPSDKMYFGDYYIKYYNK